MSQIDFKMSQIQFCDIEIKNEIITIFINEKSLWFLYHKIGFVMSQIKCVISRNPEQCDIS